ncbi:ABC transporter substrate-binding protein [Pseudonocardia sp. RS010]|uniref:ABC transporter substrate-binding protein n=1 Tax=Pseudonocardia sp. RS010 TaxID=3385979 RepID=UPI0039A318C1
MKNVRWLRAGRAAAAVLTGALLVGACGSGTGGAAGGSDAVVVAMLAPLTGGQAVSGEQMVAAAQLAVDQVNAAGGVGGRPVELKVYDDKLTADDAAKAAQRAITVDGAVAVVGTLASSSALATREVVERSEVPFLVPAASALEVTKDSRYVYRVTVDLKQLATATLEIAKPAGATTVALLHDNGAVGQGYAQQALAEAAALGLTVTPVQYSTGSSSMTAVVQAAKRLNPQAVMIAGSAGADYGLIIKSMVEEGLTVPVTGLTTMAGPDAVSVGGAAYGQLPGLYVALARDPENPKYKAFLDAYAAAHNGETKVNDFALQTYDAVNILASALTTTGGEGGKALADALSAAPPLEGASVGSGSTISFADGHDGFKNVPLHVFQIANGGLQPSDLVLN